MSRLATVALLLCLTLGARAASAADACPPGWGWAEAKPNYSCRVALEGLRKTEAEARRSLSLYQDLGAVAYANCALGVTAPSGSATVTPEAGQFRWKLDWSYSCKLPV